jgi:hypothetical protein
VALLAYGLSNAGTDQHGVSHWTDTKVIASQIGGAIGLAALGTVTWTVVANGLRAQWRRPRPSPRVSLADFLPLRGSRWPRWSLR